MTADTPAVDAAGTLEAVLAAHEPACSGPYAGPALFGQLCGPIYCKPCSIAAKEWVTWTPEHVAAAVRSRLATADRPDPAPRRRRAGRAGGPVTTEPRPVDPTTVEALAGALYAIEGGRHPPAEAAVRSWCRQRARLLLASPALADLLASAERRGRVAALREAADDMPTLVPLMNGGTGASLAVLAGFRRRTAEEVRAWLRERADQEER